MSRVDDVLRAARALADPSREEGRAAREAAVRECALSPAMADHVFALACARYTRESVDALTSAARERERVAVVLAATVAVAPLRAVALPWLAGAARVDVRGSSRQSALVDAVVRAFGVREITRVGTITSEVDAVVAYGSDETVAEIDRATPSARFEGYGHGFGVAWVDLEDSGFDAARAVALDVALHDQRGCLSPRIAFVRGDAVAFARALHEAFTALEASLPRGVVEVGEAASVMQWQGAAAARCAWSRRGRAHFVGALETPSFMASPGLRSVLVCPVSSVAEACSVMGRALAHLTCVGATGSLDAWRATGARVVRAGSMQDPALDGPEDPRPPKTRARAL
ncbi:MAG: acyl-CoA reductase [Polyangiales bacterium]